MLNDIQKTLLEFGHGFAFLGRQQKVLINKNWRRIDLLFYHIQLKCHIIVDIKARVLIPGDRDTIALIICQNHDKIDVYYSAGKNRDDIFVAEYKIKLPSEEDIKNALAKKKITV